VIIVVALLGYMGALRPALCGSAHRGATRRWWRGRRYAHRGEEHALGRGSPTAALGAPRSSGGLETGYSREEFPHWSDAEEFGWKLPSGTPDPESCDARDAALIRDGKGERVEEFCDVVSGEWFDPYGSQTYTDPEDVDIDHVVPLANAWRSGASSWDTAKSESFANVPRDLLSVDDGLNQSKGDKGPEAWKPPRKAYWCVYSKKWIAIKHYWKLSVTSAEKSALKQMLGTCGD
jgi:hypothetical protein